MLHLILSAGRPVVYDSPNEICNRCCELPICSLCPCAGSSDDSPSSFTLVSVVIIVASVICIIIVSIILCKICSKHYRNHLGTGRSRSQSISSIERLVSERLRNRPPTYQESNYHMSENDAPPFYDDIVPSTASASSVFVVSKEQQDSSLVVNDNSPPDYNSITSNTSIQPLITLSETDTNHRYCSPTTHDAFVLHI